MSKVATGSFRVAFLCVAIASLASAQELPFSRAEIGNDTARAMSTLATQAIAAYKDDNRARYLDNLFRLQLVAGRYTNAITTLRSLRALESKGDSRQAGATLLLYSIYARANSGRDGSSFDTTFQRTFREVLTPLGDKTSWLLERPLFVYLPALQQNFSSALKQQKDERTISLADALKLIRAYQVNRSSRGFRRSPFPLWMRTIADATSSRRIFP